MCVTILPPRVGFSIKQSKTCIVQHTSLASWPSAYLFIDAFPASTLSLQMFAKAWTLYNQNLLKRPLTTKMAMSAVVLGAADLGAQRLQHQQHKRETECDSAFEIDTTRQRAVCVYSVGFQGPFGHWWYNFLEHNVKARLPPHLVLGSKVLADQVVNALASNVIYFSFIPWFEGKPVEEIKQKLRMDLGPTYMLDCCFWPIASALYFRYLPVQHHLLACNSVLLVWTLFMSYVCHDDKLLRAFDDYNFCLTEQDRQQLKERQGQETQTGAVTSESSSSARQQEEHEAGQRQARRPHACVELKQQRGGPCL